MWVGSRCCTNTNAIPVSVGKFWSNSVNASKPPADAPTPTMGNPPAAGADEVSDRGGRGADSACPPERFSVFGLDGVLSGALPRETSVLVLFVFIRLGRHSAS